MSKYTGLELASGPQAREKKREIWLTVLKDDHLAIEDRAGWEPAKKLEFGKALCDVDLVSREKPIGADAVEGDPACAIPLDLEEVVVRIEGRGRKLAPSNFRSAGGLVPARSQNVGKKSRDETG